MKHQVLSLAVGAMLTSGCMTFNHQSGTGELSSAKSGQVVIQAGKGEPVVAPHDRAYYLDQRQAKNVMPRLRGALATGEADVSVGLAKSRLEKAPGDPEALMMLSSALVLTRNYDLAAYYAGLLERAQAGNPVANAFALNVKGLAAMMAPKARLADFKTAQNYFQQAFNTDSTQIAPGLNLGSLQLELGNAAGAAETFSQVVDRCGDCVPGLMGYGIALARTHQYDKAQVAFNSVLKKNPSHAGALYNLALVYKNGYNDRKQAEKYLSKLVNDAHARDLAMKDRARVVLRGLKGEATPEERARLADEDKDEAPAATGGEGDAKALMSSFGSDSDAP